MYAITMVAFRLLQRHRAVEHHAQNMLIMKDCMPAPNTLVILPTYGRHFGLQKTAEYS